jgi:DNA topoisomerase VI subunit B
LRYKKEIDQCKGSVAHALKKYLMKAISKKMRDQAEARIRHDIPDTIKEFKFIYEAKKNKEYAEIDKLL